MDLYLEMAVCGHSAVCGDLFSWVAVIGKFCGWRCLDNTMIAME